MPLPSHNAVPYLPDGAVDAPEPPLPPYPLWLSLALFLGVFALLQWAWSETRDTWVERLVVHEATVKPAAALVQMITPEANARPVAASIKAPGGGLNILNGCEGTEVMLLLIAAFAAVRLEWRHQLIGLTLDFAWQLVNVCIDYLLRCRSRIVPKVDSTGERCWSPSAATTRHTQ